MKLYIPELGDSFTLAADWNFNLYNESRNNISDAFELIYPDIGEVYEQESARIWEERERRLEELRQSGETRIYLLAAYPVMLPKGTILKVDRIYIRKSSEEFSSITFYITFCPLKELTPIKDGGTLPKGIKRRFWAKLADVNNIEFE